jgi:hypothetical protein
MNSPSSYERSLEILLQLIQGNDPADSAPLPEDSVLNNSDVLRALLTASSALQSVMDREKRRSQLPKSVGKAWTEQEEADLVKEFEVNMTVEQIAEGHQRTIRAIEARAVLLGLMKASQRTTDNAFHTKKRRKQE